MPATAQTRSDATAAAEPTLAIRKRRPSANREALLLQGIEVLDGSSSRDRESLFILFCDCPQRGERPLTLQNEPESLRGYNSLTSRLGLRQQQPCQELLEPWVGRIGEQIADEDRDLFFRGQRFKKRHAPMRVEQDCHRSFNDCEVVIGEGGLHRGLSPGIRLLAQRAYGPRSLAPFRRLGQGKESIEIVIRHLASSHSEAPPLAEVERRLARGHRIATARKRILEKEDARSVSRPSCEPPADRHCEAFISSAIVHPALPEVAPSRTRLPCQETERRPKR